MPTAGEVVGALANEVARLRQALEAIKTYAGDGPHTELGAACGIDACTGCLIHGTAAEALGGAAR